MIAIRPISDLRNKFTDIERTVNTEQALDEADAYAETNIERMTHEEVFGKLRRYVKA